MKKKHHNDKQENNSVNTHENQQTEQATENTLEEKPLEPTVAEVKDQLLRLAAEYQNYQKRAMRQIEQAGQFAAENMVKNILPVLDNFQHALEKGKNTGDIASVMQGIQIVFDHLMNTLQTAGMKKILVDVGGAFDPSRHEALMHVESADIEPGHIVMELAPGFEMNDRIIRPAKVSIAKAPQGESTPAESDNSQESEQGTIDTEG